MCLLYYECCCCICHSFVAIHWMLISIIRLVVRNLDVLYYFIWYMCLSSLVTLFISLFTLHVVKSLLDYSTLLSRRQNDPLQDGYHCPKWKPISHSHIPILGCLSSPSQTTSGWIYVFKRNEHVTAFRINVKDKAKKNCTFNSSATSVPLFERVDLNNHHKEFSIFNYQFAALYSNTRSAGFEITVELLYLYSNSYDFHQRNKV